MFFPCDFSTAKAIWLSQNHGSWRGKGLLSHDIHLPTELPAHKAICFNSLILQQKSKNITSNVVNNLLEWMLEPSGGATALQKSWVVPAVGEGRKEHSSGCPTDKCASNSQNHLSVWCILRWENGSLLLLFGMPVLPNFPWIEFYRSDMVWQAIVQDSLQWLQFDIHMGTQVDNYSTWTTCKNRHGPGHKNGARNFRRLVYITETHMNTHTSSDSRTQRELKVLKSSKKH